MKKRKDLPMVLKIALISTGVSAGGLGAMIIYILPLNIVIRLALSVAGAVAIGVAAGFLLSRWFKRRNGNLCRSR